MLNMQNVAFNYGDKVILQDVTLAVAPQQITTIIGPNGSGKSTVLDLLSQTRLPSSGMVELGEERVAYLEQHNELFEPLTVSELLDVGMLNGQGDGALKQKVMAQLDLDDITDQLVTKLSGGQHQRAWLGYALVQQPDILLLDEPTAALDVHYQVELLETLRNIQRDYQLTIVMVLHDLNQALHYSDWIWLVRGNGEIVVETAEQCYDAALLSEVFHTEVQIVAVDNEPQVLVKL
jgi:iron complex transport system ATP-binding protein